MFVLKSILGTIMGNPSNPELIQIPAGQLFLVRPDSIKGCRECIFKDAVATIRRTSVQFQYQLVVTRALDEGEELLEEDAETDDERPFLLDHALSFRSGQLDGDATFMWRDLSGDPGDMWEFVCQGRTVPKATSAVFEATVLQCMYERKYQKSHENASVAELEAMKWRPPPKTPNARSRLAHRASSPSAADALDLGALTISPQASGSGSPAPANESAVVEAEPAAADAEEEDPFKGVPILHRGEGELYLFDRELETFVLQEKVVTVDIAEGGPYDYWLIVRQLLTPFISVPLEADMVPQIDLTTRAFMFTYKPIEGEGTTWCIRYADEEGFNGFKDAFTRYMWEGKNKMNWGKAKAEEQKYVAEAYEDIEMEDVSGRADEEEEEEEEEEAEVAVGGSGGRGGYDEDESGEDEDTFDTHANMATGGKGGKNERLTIGYKHDRSFVARGDMIGVFRHTEDNQVKFATSINKVADMKGKSFTPKKMMLHNQDSDMLLMDPTNKGSVFKMDLEYGKVVEEWKVHDHVQVDNILPDSKYAQMDTTQTLVGHSHNGLFRIDPRISGNKLVESQFKQYASKNDFTSAVTTANGRIAVASNKGDIRLFDAIGKNAKTALPALGDPIIGIDTTADGRYVIATCKTYLLLIDTLIGDGRYKGSSGFDRSFPAESKPKPRRLQIAPEHLAHMNAPPSFTPARFNTGVDNDEKTIVTSSGPYVITWDFKKVKAGKVRDIYSIKQYQSNVVADDFKFGADRDIIVALEHDVFMVNKKQMQKPTRASLSTPVKNLRSRSSIVDERF